MTYRDMEKRKAYLREWKRKNSKKNYEYWKRWAIKKYIQGDNKFRRHVKKGTSNVDLTKNSTSSLGRQYEIKALSILKGSIDSNHENFRGKWDIEWNGYKIDVKVRKINSKKFYNFTTKPNPQADFYLLFCIGLNQDEYIFLVPKKDFCRVGGNYPTFVIRHPEKQFPQFRVLQGTNVNQ